MAELGFSGAIVYNMYKPLADGDENTVNALLAFYKKIYSVIGFVIFVIGIIVLPFITKFINGNYPDNVNIYILFFIQLLNTSISYLLFAYKASLIEALQRIDMEKISYLVVTVLEYFLQIVSIVIYKNYYMYLVSMLIGTVLRNISIELISRKYFPSYFCKGIISKTTKNDIISRVKGLLICNICGTTYTALDSIILSMFVGLVAVAKYNNYLVVVNGVISIITMLRTSMQASVGNSVAKESVGKNYNDMLLWQFLFSCITTLCASCMISLFQPFMRIWMGESMLLLRTDVVLLCMWFVVSVSGHPYYLYLSGTGSWWEMRWVYIISTLTNLILNIVLGKIFGISGIIFSTFFSSLIFGFVWQCIIIFKKYFERSPKEFYKRQLVYWICNTIVMVVAYLVVSIIQFEGILGLLIKALVCVIVTLFTMFILYFRTKIFKEALKFFVAVFGA